MSRARGQKQYIALTQGLITEASPLNAPEGSTSDELNMDLKVNGMIRVKRKGLQRQGTDKDLDGVITGSYYWAAANIVVLTAFSTSPDESYDTITMHFMDPADNTELYKYRFEILEGEANNPNFAEVRNRLITTFGSAPFVFIKEADGTLSAWYLDTYIRDFKLLDDNLALSERPLTLSDEHKYNIWNAGWTPSVQEDGGAESRAYLAFFNDLLEYPSNADVPSLGIGADGTGITIFKPQNYETVLLGNTPAPRGHYVFNTRDIRRTLVLTDLDRDGAVNATLTPVLTSGTNVSGLTGNLLYRDGVPVGNPTDPTPPPSGGGFEP